MRRTSVISLIVVALVASLAAAGRPAPGMYGDIRLLAAGEPNDPNGLPAAPAAEPNQVWDPAAHFVATWESLTSMSKMYNPAGASGEKPPQRSLSIDARVDVIDVNGVIGFDWSARAILVLDEKGREVYSGKPLPSRYCHFYWPLQYIKKWVAGQWVNELRPYNVAVEMPLDPNRPYPLVLSKVEWSMYALVPGQIKTVDIPFRPTTEWLTLTPGLEIKVDSIIAETGKYDYRLSLRYSQSRVAWSTGGAIALWTQDPTPEAILTKLDVLDPQGKSMRDQSGGFGGGYSAGGSGDLVTGTAHGSGSCSICGTATTFRFTLVLKPVQKELRFVLENVPVPLL